MIKSRSYRVFTLLWILVLFASLTACSKTPKINSYYKDMITDDFINRYIISLDSCLTEETELIFDDPDLIPAGTLFTFFLYDLTTNKKLWKGESYPGERWYNEADGQYHIPLSDIEAVLSSYFESDHLILPYTSENDKILTSSISGFGGNRYIKVTNKEFLSEDTVRITVDFLNESREVCYYTKVYTVRLKEDGITYLSILKNYKKATHPVSIVGLKYGWLGYVQDTKLNSLWTSNNDSTVLSPGEVLTTEFRTFNRIKQIGRHRLTEEYYSRDTYDSYQTIDALRLENREEPLWVSGDYNPLPRPVEEIGNLPKQYSAEIARRLAAGGAEKAAVNITDVLRADVDGDGIKETFIAANTARNDDWEPSGSEFSRDDTIAPGQGVYSIVLMEKNGAFTEIYSEILTEGEHYHIDLSFHIEIAGLFDLNGDGNMEICLDAIHWDCPDILIFRYEGAKIDPVMTCGFAW